MNQFDDGPIVACSTPRNSNSAIAIIRFSGFVSKSVFKDFLFFKNRKLNLDYSNLKNRYAYYVDIVDSLNGNEFVDSGIIIFFDSPNSYNGENIAELSIHGNQLNIERVLSLFSVTGVFRFAKNGEFTYRALKNKKISLSEVEGLDILLNASSPLALDFGKHALNGDLLKSYQVIEKDINSLRQSIELNIDFLEDIGEEQALNLFYKNWKNFLNSMVIIQRRISVPVKELLSPDIVLIGPTNAGKSSLFNSFLKMDRSIVSAVAGTTRDYVSESFTINSCNYKLIDTAGLRIKDDGGIYTVDIDLVEREGIERSLVLFKESFFKILVLNPLDFSGESNGNKLHEMFKFCFPGDTKVVDTVVLTHLDCLTKEFLDNSLLFSKLKSIFDPSRILFCSLTNDDSLGGPIGPHIPETFGMCLDLNNEQNQLFLNINERYKTLSSHQPVLIERHRLVLNQIVSLSNALKEYIESCSRDLDFGIILSYVDRITLLLRELVGITPSQNLLNSIFDNFCIGK